MSLKNIFKTESTTSPKGGDRACLCEDETYSKECCDGALQSQGIGSLEAQGVSQVQNVDTTRIVGEARG